MKTDSLVKPLLAAQGALAAWMGAREFSLRLAAARLKA
jgi:hypothetical protein